MGQHHIQMALVHGHIGRFADRAARMVEVRAGLGQFDEIAKVFDRAKAAATVKVHHKWAAIGGRKDH